MRKKPHPEPIREAAIRPGCVLKRNSDLRDVFEYFNGMSIDGSYFRTNVEYVDGSNRVDVDLVSSTSTFRISLIKTGQFHTDWSVSCRGEVLGSGSSGMLQVALSEALDCALDFYQGRVLFQLRRMT